MWDCVKCGCRGVAASLFHCPMCWKEREVPKVTVNSGASNGWAEVEKVAEDVAVAAVEAVVESVKPAPAKPAPTPPPAPPKPAPAPAAAKPAEPAPGEPEPDKAE